MSQNPATETDLDRLIAAHRATHDAMIATQKASEAADLESFAAGRSGEAADKAERAYQAAVQADRGELAALCALAACPCATLADVVRKAEYMLPFLDDEAEDAPDRQFIRSIVAPR